MPHINIQNSQHHDKHHSANVLLEFVKRIITHPNTHAVLHSSEEFINKFPYSTDKNLRKKSSRLNCGVKQQRNLTVCFVWYTLSLCNSSSSIHTSENILCSVNKCIRCIIKTSQPCSIKVLFCSNDKGSGCPAA